MPARMCRQRVLLAAALVLVASTVIAAPGDDLLYNEVQFIGTYQSTHQTPPQAIIDYLNQPSLQAVFPGEALDLPQDYFFSHLTLTQQLEAGVRGFELQVLSDPDGGAYAYSAGLKLAGENSFISPDLLEPGVKVFSSVDFDFGSSCYLFTDCLAEIGDWSASNQDHFPIFVVIHHGGLQSATDILGTGAAYSTALTQLQATNTLPTNFTTSQVADLADVEAEILQVFNQSQLFTPDDLRAINNAAPDTPLRDLVLAGGSGSWPTIGQLRNKVVFMGDPDYFPALSALHPNSTDSLLFFADDQGDTDPNVVMLDGYVDVLYTNFSSSTKPFSLIDNADAYATADAAGTQSLVLQGFIVRAGADSSSVSASFNYTVPLVDTATVAGPHILSTFYETTAPPALIPSNYSVNPATAPGFAGAEAVCNPVTTVSSLVTSGNAVFAVDGAIPQLGAETILQTLPNCSVPNGFSPGAYLSQPAGTTALPYPDLAPAPAPGASAA